MDLGTILGLIAFVAFVAYGYISKQFSASLFDSHAIFVVLGGSLVSLLLNTPFKYLVRSITDLRWLMFNDETVDMNRAVPMLVGLAEQCRARGISALKEADPEFANGFLSRVAAAALEYNDSNFVKHVIEMEINQSADEVNEVANVYRTLGVLSPMFGLLGTLIGIIAVLKQLSDPESVGPAMGVAISSAFFGIFLANMVCVPIAGKIRARIWLQVRLKSMILEGVLEIMKGSIPMVVERRLQSYIN